ncbi:MAG: hypothetical protein AAFU49_19805 [Pseudomonadota bacterium]
MVDRVLDRIGLWPERLIADTAYGDATMLAWLVYEQGIEPHIPVFDTSRGADGIFSRTTSVTTTGRTLTSDQPRKR